MTNPTPIDDAPRQRPPSWPVAWQEERLSYKSRQAQITAGLLASILAIASIGSYQPPQQSGSTGDEKAYLTENPNQTNFPLSLENNRVPIYNLALSSNQTPTVSHADVPLPLTATNDFVVGSARFAATVAIDTNLVTPDVLAVYSTMNHSATNYTRNPVCWAHSFDLTCVPVFNSDSFFWYTNGCCSYYLPARKGGTLISPRHIIFANHYPITNGATIRFVAMNNTVVSRVLANSLDVSTPIGSVDAFGHTNTSSSATDLRVGLLDSDVPTNLITFARVLPANYLDYFPNLLNCAASNAIPGFCLDQGANAEIADVSCISTTTAGIGQIVFSYPQNAMERPFFGNGRQSGDSGLPAFLVINGQLVIVTVWTSGGAGEGNFIYDAAPINSAMTTLGGGYKLTPIDLSGFHQY